MNEETDVKQERKPTQFYLPKIRWYERAKQAKTLKSCLYWLSRYYKENKIIKER